LNFQIDIYIPESKSRLYASVISRAKSTEYYDENTGLFSVPGLLKLFTVWDDFRYIIWTSQKWAGFTVQINNRPVMPYSNDYFYYLQDLYYCIRNRVVDESGPEYCVQSGWGCRLVNGINRMIGNTNYNVTPWYKFGKFTNSENWQINKTAIFTVLRTQAEETMCAYCPYFDINRTIQNIDSLPDNLILDEKWQILYNIDYNKTGSAAYIPVSIHHLDQFETVIPQITQPEQQSKTPRYDVNNPDEMDKYLDYLLQQKKRPK
jgi:hypothetical protein